MACRRVGEVVAPTPEGAAVCQTVPVRARLRIIVGVLVGGGAILLPAATAVAAPKVLCTVTDERIANISGIVATPEGYAVVNNGTAEPPTTKVFLLDSSCAVTSTLTSPNKPRDPQDLTRTADGTLWAADIGDADGDRPRIAVHVFPPGEAEPTIHRMTYPDGTHDAKAMFVQKSNIPVVVTFDQSGVAKVYVSTAAITGPSSDEPVPLRAAGSITFAKTDTRSFQGAVGTTMVTGAALSPDGKRAVLRTYSDAYEWDVPDGDIAKAITTGKPRRTPLPAENAQEAIAFGTDGASYVTAGIGASPALQQWPVARAGAAPRPPSTDSDSGFGLSDLRLNQITGLIVVAGVIGLLLLGVGLAGIVRFRRAQPVAGSAGGEPERKPLAERRRPRPEQKVAGHETMMLPRVPGAVYGRRPEELGAPDGATSEPDSPTRVIPPSAEEPGKEPLPTRGSAAERRVTRRGKVYGADPEPNVPEEKGATGGRAGSPAFRPGAERPSQVGGRRDDGVASRDWRAGRSAERAKPRDAEERRSEGARRRPDVDPDRRRPD